MRERTRDFRPPARRGSATLSGLFWLVGLALFVLPFLRDPAALGPEGDDPGREQSEIDIPFSEDVGYFEEDYELALGEAIASASEERFGLGSAGLAESGLVDVSRLASGAREYERHCIGCHGRYGDGAGPAARYLNPRPRNFRRGIFKFTQTATGQRPLRQDLFNTITRGLGGSSMPGFRLLSEEKRWDLVEYVRWLAIKGEFEQMMVDWAWNDEELPDPDEVHEIVVERWSETTAVYPPIPEPERTAESVARGRELYLDTGAANCVSCHGPGGRGDGPVAGDFNDDWGYPIAPRDLTTGSYRAGGTAADLYRSISTGVNGTPMTSFEVLAPEDIWALVHFVQSLAEGQPTGENR